MKKNRFAIFLFLFGVAMALSAQDRNVLFIIVDDLKPMIGAFGESQMVTPNMDTLAKNGTIFTNAHTQQAICGPSRISLLTGMRPDYTKVRDLKTFMRNMVPDILTLPEHFKNNSFESIGMGKVFHMAKNDDPQSWTMKFIDEKDLTYNAEWGAPVMKHYQLPEMKASMLKLEVKNDDIERKDLKKIGVYPATECLEIPDDAYPDGAAVVNSIELLQKFQQEGKKFFMTVGFNKPHLPFAAPKKYWDLYDRETIDLADFQEKATDSPALAYHDSGELKNYSDIDQNLDINHHLDDVKQRELIHGYYASISYVDAQIGKIVSHLKSSGLWENTIIVIVGDHGWHLGDHGLWNKHTNFEQATRTPLIIRSPDFTNPITNASPVELVDIFPTVCELANINVPESLQGSSLVSIINGESTQVKNAAISQYPRGVFMGYSVRTDRYRYTEWFKKSTIAKGGTAIAKNKAVEFYDYTVDPLETRNLADDPKYTELVKEMRANLIEVIRNEY